MKSDLVTVALLAYEHEDYIFDCLGSIENQEGVDIELIINDDNSSDSTYEKIRQFSKTSRLKKIRMYKQKENIGVTQSTNFLLDKITSDYFVIVAGDDLMSEGRLKKQVDALKKNSVAAFCISNVVWFYNRPFLKVAHHYSGKRIPTFNLDELVSDFTLPSVSAMFNKTKIKKIRLNEKLNYISDMEFFLQILKIHEAAYIGESLHFYRKHSGSITSQETFLYDRLKLRRLLKKEFNFLKPKTFENFDDLIRYSLSLEFIKRKKYRKALHLISILTWKKVFVSQKWFLRLMLLFFLLIVSIVKRNRD